MNQLKYDVSGNISWSRAKWKYYEEPDYTDSDQARIFKQSGKWTDCVYGYVSDGLFTSQAEIDAAPYYEDLQGNAMLKPGVTDAEIENAFKEMYGGEFFIRLLGKGACPEIKNIRASNYVDIGWQTDARTGRVIVMSALDNLVKGAAGQAVQNMNVMFGIDETTGLRQLPVYP